VTPRDIFLLLLAGMIIGSELTVIGLLLAGAA